MARIEGVEQNTAEWLSQRVGVVTSSRLPDVVAKRKDGQEAAARRDYRLEKVSEILTGIAATHYVSAEMQWGLDYQALACSAYEVQREIFLVPGGFWRHDKVKWFGASPDYLCGTDGLVEVKCPSTLTHLKYVSTGEVPDEYIWQIMGQLSCTNRSWCDFVSYDPRLKAPLNLWIKRVPRDESLIQGIEVEVEFFVSEIDEMVQRLYGGKNEDHQPGFFAAGQR